MRLPRWGKLGAAMVVGAIVGLVAEAAAVDYRVRWNPSPSGNVAGYNVYVGDAGGPFGVPIGVGLPTPAGDGSLASVLTGLPDGVARRFAVTAVDEDGAESAFSNQISLCGTSADCTDGNPCTGEEVCLAGRCEPGLPLVCNDGDPCTVDGCSPNGGCTRTIIPGCGPCTSDPACDDGNVCNGSEQCVAGTCGGGAALDCEDGTPCTLDACDAFVGCISQTLPGCQACTVSADCDDGNACNGIEDCQQGICQPGTSADCSDGDPCTFDVCDGETGCTHLPTGTCLQCSASVPVVLDAQRLTVMRVTGGTRFSARGFLDANVPVFPLEDGVRLEISESQGDVLFNAFVPGSALIEGRRGRLRYNRRLDVPTALGLRQLRMRFLRDGRVRVAVRGNQIQLPEDYPVDLSWTMIIGDRCGVDQCTSFGRKSSCQ